jgi:Sulfatase
VISEQSTGFPGYNSIIAKDKATIGRILLENGYATSWFGKNHNTPVYTASQVGPFDQWPIGMGFEYSPGTWNLVTGMADDAIDWMTRMHQTDPSKPIFIKYAPGATHAPHHPTNFSGVGRSGTGTLKVDGKVVATRKLEKTLPAILQWDESFDIGSDTLTGVNDADYKPPFPLTAKLNKLTIKVDRPQLSGGHQEARRKLEASRRREIRGRSTKARAETALAFFLCGAGAQSDMSSAPRMSAFGGQSGYGLLQSAYDPKRT